MPGLTTVAARVPPELERVIAQVARIEGVDRSTALRKLVERGVQEWRRERALELLRKGEVSLWKASEIAGVSLWEMVDIVNEEGVEWVRYAPEDIEREFEDAKKILKK